MAQEELLGWNASAASSLFLSGTRSPNNEKTTAIIIIILGNSYVHCPVFKLNVLSRIGYSVYHHVPSGFLFFASMSWRWTRKWRCLAKNSKKSRNKCRRSADNIQTITSRQNGTVSQQKQTITEKKHAHTHTHRKPADNIQMFRKKAEPFAREILLGPSLMRLPSLSSGFERGALCLNVT